MSKDKNTDINLFGIGINNTVAVILFYLVFSLVLGYISFSYFLIIFITQLIDFPTLSISSGFYLANLLINLFIYLGILIVYIYILAVCSRSRKLYRENGDNQIRWLGFTLNQTSLTTIKILSILNILLGLFMLYSSISSIVNLFLILSFPIQAINLTPYILNLIESFIKLLFNIYTLNRCKSFSRKTLELKV